MQSPVLVPLERTLYKYTYEAVNVWLIKLQKCTTIDIGAFLILSGQRCEMVLHRLSTILCNFFKVSIHRIELFIWKHFGCNCKVRIKKHERRHDVYALEPMLNCSSNNNNNKQKLM